MFRVFTYSNFCNAKFSQLIIALPLNISLLKQSWNKHQDGSFQGSQNDNIITGVSKLQRSNFQDPEMSLVNCLKTHASQAIGVDTNNSIFISFLTIISIKLRVNSRYLHKLFINEDLFQISNSYILVGKIF